MDGLNFFSSERPARDRTESLPRPQPRRGQRPFVMIDGYNLSLEKGTGVATYARNLSYSLRDLGCDVGVMYGGSFSAGHSRLLQEIAFFDSQSLSLKRWQKLWRKVRSSVAPSWNRGFQVPITGAVIANTFAARLPYYDSIWNSQDLFLKAATQFNLFGAFNRLSTQRRPDLFHWTYPLPMRLRGVPNIYTLHDLVPLRLPYSTLDKKDRYFRLLRWICKTAAHIVTVSENSKRDIIDLLGVHPEKVTNTYETVSIPDKYRFKPEDLVQREVEGTFGLQYKKYFLFFGSIEPKKNIGRMIEAYLASGSDTPLVIVGAQAWKSEQELRLLYEDQIRSLVQIGPETRVKRRVLQFEYAPFPLLVSLIRGAQAVLFPSLYEGFGLPVLESMLLGTPVLTSNTSSIPEVAGDAALLIDPYDTRAIAEGIRALDTNAALRADLAARGLRQAALFSEAAHQARLSSVYSQVLHRDAVDFSPCADRSPLSTAW